MSKVKYVLEGEFSIIPLLFQGADYYFWKGNMKLSLQL